VIDEHPVELELAQQGGATAPILSVSIRGSEHLNKQDVANILSAMLGLSVDLSQFYKMARKDRALATLTDPFVGMRPTRFPSLFEALLNAVACQQLPGKFTGIVGGSAELASTKSTLHDIVVLRPASLIVW
jgi:DNA-3-methyladenine glycosylase II